MLFLQSHIFVTTNNSHKMKKIFIPSLCLIMLSSCSGNQGKTANDNTKDSCEVANLNQEEGVKPPFLAAQLIGEKNFLNGGHPTFEAAGIKDDNWSSIKYSFDSEKVNYKSVIYCYAQSDGSYLVAYYTQTTEIGNNEQKETDLKWFILDTEKQTLTESEDPLLKDDIYANYKKSQKSLMYEFFDDNKIWIEALPNSTRHFDYTAQWEHDEFQRMDVHEYPSEEDISFANQNKYASMAVKLLGQKFLQGKNLQAYSDTDEFFQAGNEVEEMDYFSRTSYRFECPKGVIDGSVVCFSKHNGELLVMLGVNERSDDGYFSKLEFFTMDNEGKKLTPIANPFENKDDYKAMMERVNTEKEPSLALSYWITQTGVQIMIINAETYQDVDAGCSYDFDPQTDEFVAGGWG